MRCALPLLLALALAGCGLMGERTTTSTTKVGQQRGTDGATESGGMPGIKVVTIVNSQGVHCTLVFRDGLYVGGTC